MTNICYYYYKVIPFGLNGVDATYPRLMYLVFVEQIRKNLKVYIDDMIIRTPCENNHIGNLEDILGSFGRYNIQLKSTISLWGPMWDVSY